VEPATTVSSGETRSNQEKGVSTGKRPCHLADVMFSGLSNPRVKTHVQSNVWPFKSQEEETNIS